METGLWRITSGDQDYLINPQEILFIEKVTDDQCRVCFRTGVNLDLDIEFGSLMAYFDEEDVPCLNEEDDFGEPEVSEANGDLIGRVRRQMHQPYKHADEDEGGFACC